MSQLADSPGEPLMIRIQAPDHAGSRSLAQELTTDLAEDLSTEAVVLDCAEVVVATPSFLDEFVKQVLVERRASTLEAAHASARTADLLVRSATNRAVETRLSVDRPRSSSV